MDGGMDVVGDREGKGGGTIVKWGTQSREGWEMSRGRRERKQGDGGNGKEVCTGEEGMRTGFRGLT